MNVNEQTSIDLRINMFIKILIFSTNSTNVLEIMEIYLNLYDHKRITNLRGLRETN